MADIEIPSADFVPVRQIELNTVAAGGPEGPANWQATDLAQRDEYLKNKLSSVYVYVEDYIQASDDDDISLAIVRASNSANGRIIKLAPKLYVAKSVANIVATNCIFEATGTTIEVHHPSTFIRFVPPVFEAIQAILPVDGNGYWGQRKQVTCLDGSLYTVGDTVKVVSDDKQASTRPPEGTLDYRRGLMAVIEGVSGNDLILDRPIPWSLTTNPRIGKMPARKFHWVGGTIGYEKGHESDWKGQAMIVYGATDVFISVDINHTYNSAINLVGCFSPIVRATGRDLLNNEANQQYGYLVNDSSQFSDVYVNAGRNRHAYTTNMPTVAANSQDLYLYGATYAGTVSGQCHGNSQAGFDTHHGADSITFNNCVSSGGTTGGGQFVVRGQNIQLTNPRGFNGKEGIFVYCEVGVIEPTSVVIDSANMVVDRYPLVISENCNVVLRGNNSFRSLKYGKCIIATKSSLKITGVVNLTPGGDTDINSSRCVELTDCAVESYTGSLIFDLTAIPAGATNYGLIQHGGIAATSWRGGEITSINDDGLTAVFIKATSAGGSYLETITGCSLKTSKLGYTVGQNTNINVTGANGSVMSAWSWRQISGQGGSNYLQATVAAAGYLIPWRGRGDDVTTVRLFNNTVGSLDLGALPANAEPGQILNISMTTAGGALVIKHGAAYNTGLPGGADITLTSEQGVSLICNGAGRWNALRS